MMSDEVKKYYDRYEEIKHSPDFAYGLAQKFVAEIVSLPSDLKCPLLPLLKQIDEYSFTQGVTIPNLNFNELARECEQEKSNFKTTRGKRHSDEAEKENDDITSKLEQTFRECAGIIGKVKGHFIFCLQNALATKTRILILCDEDCNKHPEVVPFDQNDENASIEKYSVDDFITQKERRMAKRDENYVCLLLVSSNIRNRDQTIPKIRTLKKIFDKCSYIAVKKYPLTQVTDYEIREFEDGVEVIESFSSKIFNNKALSFQEDLVVKRLFQGNDMVLDYKFLKSGNSGSKVIEIQPIKGNHPIIGRFVVKFAEKDGERKIQKEHRSYAEFIEELVIQNYAAKYVETEFYEAIRYSYASSNGKSDSFSFNQLINDRIRGKYQYPFDLASVVNDLFECAPFQRWKVGQSKIEIKVKDLYEDYIRSEDKVFKTIALIKDIKESSVNKETVVKNYQKIKNIDLKTKVKICHGDLHSENFFKDDQGVYLIDFGWTGKRHALIDHATLESSLKFKHLPFYIPIEELRSYEQGMLKIDSFSSSFDLTFIRRQLGRDVFQLITQLREKSREFMASREDALEYLVALFIITFRYIQYPDLNQFYALLSAEILSDEIISLANVS